MPVNGYSGTAPIYLPLGSAFGKLDFPGIGSAGSGPPVLKRYVASLKGYLAKSFNQVFGRNRCGGP